MLSEICRINEFLATHALTKRRRLSATARVLRWQITSRFCDELIVDWIGGTRFAARRGMTGVTGNIYAGLYAFADMAFVLHFLRAGDLFADVGAQYWQLHGPGIRRHWLPHRRLRARSDDRRRARTQHQPQ
jgi:hypothetical protein